MTAHQDSFPWMSYYGNYDFFEQRMLDHSKVYEFRRVTPSLYEIILTDGQVLKTFICECYSFDVAEYVEVCRELGEIDAVVISSNWCGYSPGVKRHCMDRRVGVYDIRGFMAAINKKEFWNYLTKDEKKMLENNGWF
ncbi:hypothetical protein [Thioalkalivibrio sp. ALJ1]|uniref:hypothetical protein n=1 Tax=Thioalkalivibrio sp. ALJ1 TaxID=1158144 RepID=UPI000571A9FF|nr:hypothetical protein [Thioalkalivibrio sp. ALJ1]